MSVQDKTAESGIVHAVVVQLISIIYTVILLIVPQGQIRPEIVEFVYCDIVIW